MRFCLMLEGQEGPTWDQWLRVAETAERAGFEALFSSDHYSEFEPGGGSHDAWTILAGIAARTERLRVGTLVSPVTFRHPSVLAKVATTVDRISGGRVELGIGAGWFREEHVAHGFAFPPDRTRMEMFEEQLEIVHGLFTQDTFSFHGAHYTLERCRFAHKPVQRPHPPIIVGGKGGPRLARAIARFADEFNTVGGTPEDVERRYANVRHALERADRDPSEVTMSFMTWFFVGEDEDAVRERVARAHPREAADGTLDAMIAELAKDNFVGTPEQVAERLSGYAAAGVERVMLNHSVFDDTESIELLATGVFPLVKA
jgi:F420-dependent oxidoreductase-like protein